MNIAIIGAGFTGLSAGYYLSKKGHRVSLFEKDDKPGGLAVGFRTKNWDWSFEEHYHHWFSNDDAALSLADDIHHPVVLKRPKTSVYVRGQIYQLDSPRHVLTFPLLSMIERLRMAAVIGALRINPIWKPLERATAHKVLKEAIGGHAYKMLWEPQLKNKFGDYYKRISLSWFWARIKKRTPRLAYPSGGYLQFAEAIVDEIENENGKVRFGVTVEKIKSGKRPSIKIKGSKNGEEFDAIIVTTPSPIFARMAPDLPKKYVQDICATKGLGAMNLVLRLRKPFMKDGTYWLSICDSTAPVLAVVEHTNFMDKKHYNGEHLVYVGNYLSPQDKRFGMKKDDILRRYDPFLKKINPSYRKHLIGAELFRAPYAQPIIETHYSRLIPAFSTPLRNIYLSNMQQVYPWDRGTNYAIEMGRNAANTIGEGI